MIVTEGCRGALRVPAPAPFRRLRTAPGHPGQPLRLRGPGRGPACGRVSLPGAAQGLCEVAVLHSHISRQERRTLRRGPRADERCGQEQPARGPRVRRHPGEATAQCGGPGAGIPGFEGAEAVEGACRRRHPRRGQCSGERQPRTAGRAPDREVEDGGGEVRREHLRRGGGGERRPVGLRTAAPDGAGTQARRTSGALRAGGLGLTDRDEPAHAAPGVEVRHPGQARIDHHPHAGHGEGGLRHGGRDHDPAPGGGGRTLPCREDPLLFARGSGSGEREHLARHPVPDETREALHLPPAGSEHEDVRRPGSRVRRCPCLVLRRFFHCPVHRLGHVDEEVRPHPAGVEGALRRRSPADGERMRHRFDAEHGRGCTVLTQQLRPCSRVQRGGHREQREILAQLRELAEHAEGQVRVQAAFVHLVEHHRLHTTQLRVAQQATQEHTRRDELDPRPPSGLRLSPHCETHLLAHLQAAQLRQAGGCGAGGHPPGLGDEDARGRGAGFGRGICGHRTAGHRPLRQHRCQRGRHHGGLAGAGRCLDHGTHTGPAVRGDLLRKCTQPRDEGGGRQTGGDAVEGEAVRGEGRASSHLLSLSQTARGSRRLSGSLAVTTGIPQFAHN
jgi:hypothetical protein